MREPMELDWLHEPVVTFQEERHVLSGPFGSVVRRLAAWLHGGSLFGLGLNLSCCGPEMLAGSVQFNLDLHAPRAGGYPEAVQRSNLLVVAGTISEKLAPRLVEVYTMLAPPKYVIALGACACTGGPYWDAYSVVDGVHKLFPVDVYVTGCPPRPEALLRGLQIVQDMAVGQRPRELSCELPAVGGVRL